MFYNIQPADVVLLLLSLSPLDIITSVLVNLVQKISLLVYICSQKHGWNAQPVARSNLVLSRLEAKPANPTSGMVKLYICPGWGLRLV